MVKTGEGVERGKKGLARLLAKWCKLGSLGRWEGGSGEWGVGRLQWVVVRGRKVGGER